MDTPVKSVECWLKALDDSMMKYVPDFKKLDFRNIKTLKFFTADDFDEFEVPPSAVHRRMIMNGVAKLQTPNSKLGLATGTDERGKRVRSSLQPKKLSFKGSDRFGESDDEEQDEPFTYKSPAELMLDDLEEKVIICKAEKESAEIYAEELKYKYANPTIGIDKTKTQCSKCHLRDGHKRPHCQYGNCQGPESCNDIDRHPIEKKQLSDANMNFKTKEKELANLLEELQSKKKAVKDIQSSFKYQIQTDLINSNLSSYTFMTKEGRALRQTAINNDTFILQKHYKNKVPSDLKSERKKFQNIINTFNKQFTCSDQSANLKKQTVDPTRKLLESKGVEFPVFRSWNGPSTTSDVGEQMRLVRESLTGLVNILPQSFGVPNMGPSSTFTTCTSSDGIRTTTSSSDANFSACMNYYDSPRKRESAAATSLPPKKRRSAPYNN